MTAIVGLTDAKIRALKPPETGQSEYPDSLVPGLRLRVGSSGAKTFILRKRVGGRARNLTIDRYHELLDTRRGCHPWKEWGRSGGGLWSSG